jgi:transcriptional regulator with XRE-family HTH domain
MANERKSIGDYIREQREQARISVRQLASATGVSNPYLSQIERGLRKPSADILQQIAKGLRISAEALYVQAGILEDRPADSGVRSSLLTDPDLSERQKQVLIEIYESFRKENAEAAPAPAGDAAEADAVEQAEARAEAEAHAVADAKVMRNAWAVAARDDDEPDAPYGQSPYGQPRPDEADYSEAQYSEAQGSEPQQDEPQHDQAQHDNRQYPE